MTHYRKRVKKKRGGDGAPTSKTQTQSNGCDGRISIVHLHKIMSTPPPSLHPNPEKYIFMYIVDFSSALSRRQSQMMSVRAEKNKKKHGGGGVGGGGGKRGQQLKKKARMIQSLRIPYFRCKMDIRVET